MGKSVAELGAMLQRRRLAITQAEALLKHAETQYVSLIGFQASPSGDPYIKVAVRHVTEAVEVAITASDHILTQQVISRG